MNSEDSASSSEDVSHTVASVQGETNLDQDANAHHHKPPMNQASESCPIPATATERALRRSELTYRRLFEAARDGVLILDVDTRSK